MNFKKELVQICTKTEMILLIEMLSGIYFPFYLPLFYLFLLAFGNEEKIVNLQFAIPV